MNKVALIVIEIICVALIFGYISDYIAGYASKFYFIIFEITAILTAIIIPITYKTRPSKIKYIAFTCFSLVYLVALYRPTIDLVFVMAFPIVIVFVLYYDFKLMCIMSATFITITLWDCIKLMFIMRKHHSGLPLNSSILNANVEAAHAGDSGRGFAVVATEISNMSTQTKEATDNISDLIHNATTSLDDLVASVTEMTNVIQSEKDQTVQTSEIFGTIQNSTEEVRNHMSFFIDYIHGLTDANREIVQSVSTISATTQEVTALTSEALSKEHANAESVSSIAEQIGSLAQNE